MRRWHLLPSFYVSLAFAALLAFYLSTTSVFTTFMHNDLGWHIAAGDWILARHAIAKTDPWSYASDGFEWVNLAWGWDILASIVYRFLGIEGHLLLTFFAGGLCLYLMYLLALRYSASEKSAALISVFVLICLPFYGLPDIFFFSSPQLASYVLILLLLLILQNNRAGGVQRKVCWMPLILVVWVNVHNSFLLGLGMIGLYAVESLLRRDFIHFRGLVICGIAAFAATFMNPFGWDAHRMVLLHTQHVALKYVTEWQPLYELFQTSFVITFLPCLIVLELYGLMWWKNYSQWRHKPASAFNTTDFPVAHYGLSVFLLIAAVLQYRYFSLWLIVSAPLIARQFRNQVVRVQGGYASALVVYLALLMLIFPWVISAKYPDGAKPASFRYPEKAADYIVENYPAAKVMNHWNMGSWLILNHRQHMQVFIDGRAGTAYPDAVFEKLEPVWRDQSLAAWEALLQAYPPEVIIWPVRDEKNLAILQQLAGWHEVYRDEDGIVLAKDKVF